MVTHVVTVFLRHDAAILLLKRSEAVGTYQGRWGGVSGYVDAGTQDPSPDTVDAAATQEIAEETGLSGAVTLVRRGSPVQMTDADVGREWIVHPRLYDCTSRAVDPNHETTEWAWVMPPAMFRRDTVPGLWDAYQAVAPTVDTVADDTTHGASYLSIRALEVLRDRAAAASEQGTSVDLPDLARQLRAARPGMAAVRNRVNRVMHTAADADGHTNPVTVERAAEDTIEAAIDADDLAATNAADLVTGRLVTCSRSETVTTAIHHTDTPILIAESRPGGEGRAVAGNLADADRQVTLTPDATIPRTLEASDTVLVGADAVRPDGSVHNKVGTYPLALAADHAGATTLVVTAADKVTPDDTVQTPDAPEDTLTAPPGVTIHNPLFETTPADLIDGIVTEWGSVDPTDIAALAEDLAALGDWDDPD